MKHFNLQVLSVTDIAPWDDGIPACVQSVHLIGLDRQPFAGAIRQAPAGLWAVTGSTKLATDAELQDQSMYLSVISEFPQVPA